MSGEGICTKLPKPRKQGWPASPEEPVVRLTVPPEANGITETDAGRTKSSTWFGDPVVSITAAVCPTVVVPMVMVSAAPAAPWNRWSRSAPAGRSGLWLLWGRPVPGRLGFPGRPPAPWGQSGREHPGSPVRPAGLSGPLVLADRRGLAGLLRLSWWHFRRGLRAHGAGWPGRAHRSGAGAGDAARSGRGRRRAAAVRAARLTAALGTAGVPAAALRAGVVSAGGLAAAFLAMENIHGIATLLFQFCGGQRSSPAQSILCRNTPVWHLTKLVPS